MRYRIEYNNGKHCDFAERSKDLINRLKKAGDGSVPDISRMQYGTNKEGEFYREKIIEMVRNIDNVKFLQQIWTIVKRHIEKERG